MVGGEHDDVAARRAKEGGAQHGPRRLARAQRRQHVLLHPLVHALVGVERGDDAPLGRRARLSVVVLARVARPQRCVARDDASQAVLEPSRLQRVAREPIGHLDVVRARPRVGALVREKEGLRRDGSHGVDATQAGMG